MTPEEQIKKWAKREYQGYLDDYGGDRKVAIETMMWDANSDCGTNLDEDIVKQLIESVV